MKFVLEIELGEKNTRNVKEVAKTLIDFASKLYPCAGFTLIDHNIYDIERNVVGFFEIKDDDTK